MTLQFWVANGAAYIAMLFATGWWRTMVPQHWSIFPDSIRDVGTYLTFHIPPKISGMPFDHAQLLSYFFVVFILAPFQILTGAAMSPSIIARFPWYGRLFGGRQRARSLHFLGLVAFAIFVVVHTAMVIINGLPDLWTVMVLGHAEQPPYHGQTEALVVGALGLFGVAGDLRHRHLAEQTVQAGHPAPARHHGQPLRASAFQVARLPSALQLGRHLPVPPSQRLPPKR